MLNLVSEKGAEGKILSKYQGLVCLSGGGGYLKYV